MCIKWFKKKSPIPVIIELPPLVLPYPEEARNLDANIYNINLHMVVEAFLIKYKVPEVSHDYFRSIKVILDENLPYPAAKFGDNELRVHPQWANPGIIAHEMAHFSYPLMNNIQQEEFACLYKIERDSNDLVKLVFQTHGYAYTNDVEAHAEIYRYLGYMMSEVLKKYYPRLF